MDDSPFATTTDVNGKPIPQWQARLERMYTDGVPFGEVLGLVRYLVGQSVTNAYERAAEVAESAQYNDTEIRGRANGDEYYAEAGHEQARRDIAAAIRALKGAV